MLSSGSPFSKEVRQPYAYPAFERSANAAFLMYSQTSHLLASAESIDHTSAFSGFIEAAFSKKSFVCGISALWYIVPIAKRIFTFFRYLLIQI
ncbi:hypothetical protein ACFP1I_08150 [Dyadobacter subterraneus]|uniref:Uncharacterized protein n=1 Tax=Dyadobacter subterraneus TaxID=2773304 RepID=A0ABR9WG47_9BACT|nr:hypothetical protein [Dyadobacter subterraneus]MBE9463891.1 hypothetical protein [Dyadobacter subterraneus]